MIINNAKLVLKDKVVNGSIKTKGSLIEQIKVNSDFPAEKSQAAVDAKGNYLMPGVIDLHSHGCGGFDAMDGEESDIINAGKSYALHGTTTVLPTTLTSSDEDLFLFFKNLRSVVKKQQNGQLENCAKMPGAHLEGPYFDMVQKGAQDPRYICNPQPKHYNKIMEMGSDLILRWSVAPELEGAFPFIDFLVKNNILVSAAHTNAEYRDIAKAYDHGVKLLTHFYSGMSSIERKGGFRVLGAVEAGYLIDDMNVELICDGLHLPPELLKMIFKLKRNDKIIACSDSMRGAGMPEGPSILGPKNNGVACVIEDGIAKMPDRTCFAGSVATGDRLVRTLYKTMGLPLNEVSKIVSLQSAELISMDKQTGSLEKGKDADFFICDEDINIKSVFINGKKI